MPLGFDSRGKWPKEPAVSLNKNTQNAAPFMEKGSESKKKYYRQNLRPIPSQIPFFSGSCAPTPGG